MGYCRNVGYQGPYVPHVTRVNCVRILSTKSNTHFQFSTYQPVHVPTLTCGHELWIVTERTRLWIQGAEVNFICRVPRLSLRDGFKEGLSR